MIKIFTTNKDGKIELTKKELEDLLVEVKKDGVREYLYSCSKATPEPDNKPYPLHIDSDTMLRVDYENLPKQTDDLYEKAPYWMNPNFKITWT